MNVTITHTHTLAPELISLLQQFVNRTNGGSQAEKPVKELKAVTPAVTTTATPATTDDADISLEQIRAVASEKGQAGKREEVKKILAELGAEKLTALEKKDYGVFMQKLQEL